MHSARAGGTAVVNAHDTAMFDDVLDTVLRVLDLAGTFVFALSGAMAGVKRRFDFFGVMVVSFAAATAGGITRDLLINAAPPAAIRDWRYLAASLLAGFVTFYWHRLIERLRSPVQLFDAAGLALFAVTGTQKSLAFGVNPPMAIVLGMLTGIGGGIMRDLLTGEMPTVLRSEVYAVAAMAGATLVAAGRLLGMPSGLALGGGAALCFAIRMVAIRRSWRLPAPPVSEGPRA